MIRGLVSTLLVVSAAVGCSKRTEPKPLPPTLTITNPPPAIASAVPASPTGKIEQGFEVKNAGALYLTFPKTWKNSLKRVQEVDRMFDAIQFLPPNGGAFAMMVEVINVGETNTEHLDTKMVLEKAGKGELERSVEMALEIQELNGPQVTGSYFIVTDKNVSVVRPVPGEYPYLTQGYAKIGGLVLTFRIVSNHLAEEQKAGLEMVRTAKFVKK